MKLAAALGLIGFLVSLDQILPRLADRQIRTGGKLEVGQTTLAPDFTELTHRSQITCNFSVAYVVYLYQICLRPHVSGTDKAIDGYHLVYHKPKPKLTVIMPAGSRKSYYFEESVQGEFILFVQRDGSIRYGDGR